MTGNVGGTGIVSNWKEKDESKGLERIREKEGEKGKSEIEREKEESRQES